MFVHPQYVYESPVKSDRLNIRTTNYLKGEGWLFCHFRFAFSGNREDHGNSGCRSLRRLHSSPNSASFTSSRCARSRPARAVETACEGCLKLGALEICGFAGGCPLHKSQKVCPETSHTHLVLKERTRTNTKKVSRWKWLKGRFRPDTKESTQTYATVHKTSALIHLRC